MAFLANLRNPIILGQITAVISEAVLGYAAAFTPNKISDFYMAVNGQIVRPGQLPLKMQEGSNGRAQMFVVPSAGGQWVRSPVAVARDLLAILVPTGILPAGITPAQSLAAIEPSIQAAVTQEVAHFRQWAAGINYDLALSLLSDKREQTLSHVLASPSTGAIWIAPFSFDPIEIADTRVVQVTYSAPAIEMMITPDYQYYIHAERPGISSISGRILEQFADLYFDGPRTTYTCFIEVVGPPPAIPNRNAVLPPAPPPAPVPARPPAPPPPPAPMRAPPPPGPPPPPPPPPPPLAKLPPPAPKPPPPIQTCTYQASLTDPNCMPK